MALAAALVLCLSVALGSQALAKGPVVPRSFFGVVSQTRLATADIDRMGQGQIGTLRLIINWATIQTTEGGGYDWSAIDPIVLDAARNGIEVIPFVFGTPTWVAKGLDHRKCGRKTCGLYAPASVEALTAWNTFLTEAVSRYGPGGSLFAANPGITPLPIEDWQIWNEQNSPSFYLPRPDPKGYAALVAAASDAIHAKDPAAKVILGGMFGTPSKKKKYVAANYLKSFYAVPGIADKFEGVGAHPYSARLPKVEDQVRQLHNVMVNAGDGAAELWITEVGWSSGTGKNPLERGKQGQAARLRQAMQYFLAHQASYNIQNVTWFAWRDLAGKPICQWCADAGLFKAKQLIPKPSWQALMGFTGGS